MGNRWSWLPMLALVPLQTAPVPPGEPERGAVIEEVAPASAAEKAEIRPGDVILSWSQGGSGGPVADPFELDRIGLEQAPRGAVALHGNHQSEDRVWIVPPGSWGLRARPTLAADLRSLYQEGRDRNAAGDLAAGADRWRSAIAATEKHGDLLRAAWLQGGLARALAGARQWDAADAAWAGAIERLQRSAPAAAAQLLREQGETLQQRNAWDHAVEAYRRALALDSEESLAAARDLSALGTVASRRGDLAAAEDLFRRSRAIREKLAPGSLEVASSLRELAVVAARRGDLAAAEEGFGKALEIQQRLAPEGLEIERTLSNLGNVAWIRGDLASAEELHRRSLRILERLDPDSPGLATTLGNLGVVDMTRGDLAVAEERFRRALAIDEKIAPESLEVASVLNNLGILAEKRGDFAAAEEHHRRALAIREKIAPGSPDVTDSLANLGTVADRRGDPVKAEEWYRRAEAIREKEAPDSYYLARLLTLRAIAAVSRGDLDLADELHARAGAITERQSPGSLLISDALESRGYIALQRGDLVKAEDFFRRSLEIREKLAPGSIRLGMALNNLGEVDRRAGRREAAAERFCRATEAFDRQREKLGGTTEGKSAFGGEAAEYYRDCVAALVEISRPEEAFHALERGRARSFLDLLADRDLKPDLPPELARERREADVEYDRVQADLDGLSPARDQAEIGRLQVRLRELQARQAEVAAKVRQVSPRDAALRDPQPLDLAGARAVLDPGTLLLAWSIGRERSYLFVVQPAGSPGRGLEVFPLNLSDHALRQRIEAFRNLLQRAGSDRSSLATQARELYEMLLRPAEARIAAARRLLISPDGPLHTLPFAALVWNGRYLAERKPIHTVLSATVYAELRKSRRAGPAPSAVTLAAFGDPRYPPQPRGAAPSVDPDVRAAAGRGLALTPLPASRDEVRGIAALFPGARTFLGAEATEERAKSLGGGARYVHFACHGLLDERSPLNSALALSIPAGPREGQENGLLQAWEIFESVRLDADLVTLSACDSALGPEMGGEGLLGLTRAFQYAGARSVLASLWSVSDVSTAELMQHFYGYLRKGRTKDEALRAAQVELIRSRRFAHPYYWAAFQLSGDWR